MELHFVGLGFWRTLEINWLGLVLGPGLELVRVHAGGVELCLLYLHGIVGLKGCDGAGKGGQSLSVIMRGEGTSYREGTGGVFGSGLFGVDLVRLW